MSDHPQRRRPFVFTRESIRRLDRAAIEEYGIPGIVLMENAAAAVERQAMRLMDEMLRSAAPSSGSALVLILCGPGNNGGDGLAVARRLHNQAAMGAPAEIKIALCAPRDRFRGDAMTNLVICERMRIPLEAPKPGGFLAPDRLDHMVSGRRNAAILIVDAIFGTGLDRAAEPPISDVMDWANALRDGANHARVIAVDIPSGLNCDTGMPPRRHDGAPASCIRADLTVTLAGLKRGFLNPEARTWTGDVFVGDIGAPVELMRRLASEPGTVR